ncbi:MAG: hypothetical protein HY050_02940 [Actinobacteria bacterium]|nr:hypothetical protein [Actinomycetota bacterium]
MELVRPEMRYFESFIEGIKRVATADESFFRFEVRDLDEILRDPGAFIAKQQSTAGGGDAIKFRIQL